MRKPKNYWNKENVFRESKKYQSRKEFSDNNGTAYKIALKNNWLDEMKWLVDGRLLWETKKIHSVYKYYFKETNSIYIGRTNNTERRDREHLFDNDDSVYIYAKENGFAVPPMEIIEGHITLKESVEKETYWEKHYRNKGYNILNRAKTGSIGPYLKGKWNKKSVFDIAMECKTKKEFLKMAKGAYEKARQNGWLKEMTWFEKIIKPSGYWTKERVFNEGKKYKTGRQFRKYCGSAYNVAYKNKWLDEIFPKYKTVA